MIPEAAKNKGKRLSEKITLDSARANNNPAGENKTKMRVNENDTN